MNRSCYFAPHYKKPFLFSWFCYQVWIVAEGGKAWFLVQYPQKKYPMYSVQREFVAYITLTRSINEHNILKLELLFAIFYAWLDRVVYVLSWVERLNLLSAASQADIIRRIAYDLMEEKKKQ